MFQASNVRFLDDHELHVENVELYKVKVHLHFHLIPYVYPYSLHNTFLVSHYEHNFDCPLQTLPFAAGQALARGILDSLMSTTYFNASALRLIR